MLFENAASLLGKSQSPACLRAGVSHLHMPITTDVFQGGDGSTPSSCLQVTTSCFCCLQVLRERRRAEEAVPVCEWTAAAGERLMRP